jgi:hypothetical protein
VTSVMDVKLAGVATCTHSPGGSLCSEPRTSHKLGARQLSNVLSLPLVADEFLPIYRTIMLIFSGTDDGWSSRNR